MAQTGQPIGPKTVDMRIWTQSAYRRAPRSKQGELKCTRPSFYEVYGVGSKANRT